MIRLIDLEVYKTAMDIGEKIWAMVERWDYFSKDTLGRQFVRAADSIALNIAEGYGRFFYKENKNFNYYSRGSAFECTACLQKSFQRKLITEQEHLELRNLFERYFKLMNGYIKSIGQQTNNNLQDQQANYTTVTSNDLNNLLTNDPMTNDPMTI